MRVILYIRVPNPFNPFIVALVLISLEIPTYVFAIREPNEILAVYYLAGTWKSMCLTSD
jgi:Na+-translocating ferredoxin:NAD+ oxidoreductase RnfD subunit